MVLPSLVLGPEAFINYQALVSSLYNGIDMTRLSGLLGEIKKVAQSMYVVCHVEWALRTWLFLTLKLG